MAIWGTANMDRILNDFIQRLIEGMDDHKNVFTKLPEEGTDEEQELMAELENAILPILEKYK